MIAVANNIKELIEIRKFAVQMESVLKVEYEKTSFPGKYITEEERVKNNLKKEDNKDELWIRLTRIFLKLNLSS